MKEIFIILLIKCLDMYKKFNAKFWLNFEPLVKIRNVSNLVTCYHEKKETNKSNKAKFRQKR